MNGGERGGGGGGGEGRGVKIAQGSRCHLMQSLSVIDFSQ